MKKNVSKALCLVAISFGFLFSGGLTEAGEQEASSVTTGTMYSKNLGIDWNYDVYTPAGFDPEEKQTYPVIYLLHGLYGNHRNLLERFDSQTMLDEAIKETGEPAIVVFIDGFNSFYINTKNGMAMEKAIMKDLVPFIEKEYPIKKDPKKQAIGGISMGGYGAARLALRYPDQFQSAVLMSPAVWERLAKDNLFYQSLHVFNDGKKDWSWKKYDSVFPTKYVDKKDAKKVQFYIETSAKDQTVPVKDVQKFNTELKDADIKTTFIEDSEGEHNWDYWKTVAPKAYKWTLEQFAND